MLEYLKRGNHTCGIDEAGRGCLAGPVTAAACILYDETPILELNDSKKLTLHQRETIRHEILLNSKIHFAIQFVKPEIIDEINILNATFMAMNNSVSELMKNKINIEKLLIDGNRFKNNHTIPFECIVKGDSKIACIAAASVLAKTERDIFMNTIHHEFPEYGWDKNKGYGTKKHIEAIQKYGLTKYHRKSFQLKTKQLTLDFDSKKRSNI